ncbi:MAG: EAL domain-containing protein [Deltaproteobacteria bacterium]|jgi:lactose/cellobiose-specific phosphotransferase system IIC component|nr:EAL domain-containing protein [Deltaproteobacteria bacterium]
MLKRIIVGFLNALDTTIIPDMEKISSRPLLVAVRSSLAVTMPLMLIGSLAVLINSFPLPAYARFMESVFGPNWKLFGQILWSGTFAVMSLAMQFSLGVYIIEQYNARNPKRMVRPIIPGLVSFITLLCLMSMEPGGLSTHWMGVSGLFVAILVAVSTVNLFLFLYSFSWLHLSLPGGTPDFALPDLFNSLLPAMLTVLIFTALGFCLQASLGVSPHESVNLLLRAGFEALGDSVQRGMFYIFSLQGLWFMGIHGANVLDPVTHDIYGAAMAANELAASLGQPLPHVMTKTFMDVFVFMGGAGTSISLIGALLLCGETRNQRRLAGLSLIPGIFNLNEIILFGLPVILNPVMLVPFMLTPMVLACVSYFAVASGLVPGVHVTVFWTTPVFLNAYLATESVRGMILQVINLCIGVGIYAPFVVMGDRINRRRADKAFKTLLQRVLTPTVEQMNTLSRTDEAGVLARSLVADLEYSFLNNDGLFVEYQPQISASTGRVIGAEALLRWRHPYYGLVPAPISIALAEDAVMIKPLGLWIFEQACITRRAWLEAGIEDLVVAVNISALQLEERMVTDMAAIMRRQEIMADLLEIEVTESAMLDAKTVQSVYLSQLHMLGLRIAIDDFGMGYNSLKYLKQFPVATVKIDGGVSREVATNPICADIVSSVTRLCRARGMNCVAEFVENEAQAAMLRTLGVDSLQGYRFSQPLSPEDCLAYIKETNAASFGRKNSVRLV